MNNVETPKPKSSSGTFAVKAGLAQMLKGGVIMDVINAEQAKLAEDSGAVAVMALELMFLVSAIVMTPLLAPYAIVVDVRLPLKASVPVPATLVVNANTSFIKVDILPLAPLALIVRVAPPFSVKPLNVWLEVLVVGVMAIAVPVVFAGLARKAAESPAAAW